MQSPVSKSDQEQRQGRRLSEQEIIQQQIEHELKRKLWKEQQHPLLQQQQQQQQLQQQQTERQEQRSHQLAKPNDQRRASVPAAAEEEVGEEGQGHGVTSSMAERAISSRLGRRDRSGLDNLENSEIKRRSRSEGPVKGRVRQSMDERGEKAGRKQPFDGGGLRARDFCVGDGETESSGDLSDPGKSYRRAVPRADSDSDSDRQRWTKNPVVVRKFKKSDKHARNRLSGGSGLTSGGGAADSGSGAGSLYGNEDAAASSGGGGGAGGSGSGGRNKYQRLEEMRRRRINMAATSDEEGAATPAVRISRLRQRALQSGLGGSGGGTPARPASSITPSSSGGGFRNFISGSAGSGNIDKSPTPVAQFVPYQREISNTSTSSSSQQQQPWTGMSQIRHHPADYQAQSKNTLVYTPLNTGSASTSISQRPQIGGRTPPARPPPPNVQVGIAPKIGQASFHTIPDASNQQTSRALYTSSPDMASQRFAKQNRVPSADFILNPASQHNSGSQHTPFQSERFTPVQNTSHIARRSSGGSVNIQSHIRDTSNQNIPSRIPSQGGEALEMRFNAASRNASQEKPKSQSKIPKKGIIQKLGLSEDYEDSLDELIESNIQYLDTEIDKASKAAKRASVAGTNVNRPSSLFDPRKVAVGSALTSSTRNQLQELKQYRQEEQLYKPSNFLSHSKQPPIQVQANTSIQLHVSLPGELKNPGPPRIQIAAPNDFPFKPYPLQTDPMTSSVTTKLDHMQPDVVPRKYSYDSSGLRMPRPTSEYQYFGDRDDLSKSDSQLSTYILPRQLGHNDGVRMSCASSATNRPMEYSSPAYNTRSCISDINLSSEPRTVTDSAVASSSNGNLLQVLQVDKGMFSDVEYDIEVSERVKKWETFMKDRDATGEKKTAVGNLNLAPIQENTEASNEPLMLPSAVRRSVLLSKSSSTHLPPSNNSISAYSSSIVSTAPASTFSYSTTEVMTYTPPTRHRPFSSDTSINKIGDKNVLSINPTSSNRFFQAIQNPLSDGNRLGPLGYQNPGLYGAQSTGSLLQQQGPIRIKTSYTEDDGRNLGSGFDLRGQMSNRQPLLQLTGAGPVQTVQQPTQVRASPLHITSISSASTPPPQHGGGSSNNTPVVVRKRKPSRENGVDPRDPTRRGSKYQEEIDEINNVRTDSVGNLRKRFDPDSATMTSEDDQKSVVSTASARLSRPGRVSSATSGRVSGHRSGGESSSTDWTSMIPGYEKKIRDSDVWSPNLESTQGVPVSIERVTARTLQTIPFSEDPFWKELEEMTSFDPSSMAGHLSLGASQDGGPTPTEPFIPLKSKQQLEVASSPAPHSSTLPAPSSLTHSRTSGLSSKDRLQRSKSLYTPNFTPLSIDVDRTPSNAVSALDEVLNDINRSSMERKQLSPKKKLESTINLSPVKQPALLAPNYSKPKLDVPQTTFKFEDGQFKFMKSALTTEPSKKFEPVNLMQMRTEQALLPQKQPLQFYQLQRQQQQQTFNLQPPQQDQKANRQSQAYSNVNNYQLDPNLLKEKLLSTGLVVETDTEDNAPASASMPCSSRAPLLFTQTPFTLSNPSLSQSSISSNKSVADRLNSSNVSKGSPRPGSMYTSTSNTPLSSSRFASDKSNPANPFQVSKVGTSALDDIQRALAPFSNTSSSYQPGPESLYGTARLESFMDDSGLNTFSGPNTEPTSWKYQPSKRDTFLSSSGGIPGMNSEDAASSSSRLQQVNASMDDLKDLAQNVERRINVIKTRLQSADESSLDTILSSLKSLQPDTEVRRCGDGAAAAAGDADSASAFEDYYTSKKTKLSKALTELDRIYKSLDLNSDDMTGLPEKSQPQHQYKLYRPTRSSDFVLASQPKSIHLRPMQTRVSSVYIPGLEKQKSEKESQGDKDTESEFDVISKSFQAIVDEVNKTTNLLSKANEDALQTNQTQDTVPETQKNTLKITLKPEESDMSNLSPHVPSSDLTTDLSSDVLASKKEPPETAPKPQDAVSTTGKEGASNIRPQISTYDNIEIEEASQAAESESSASDPQKVLTEEIKTKPGDSNSSIPTSTTSNIKTSTTSTPQKSSPVPRQRIRPVRDNKIVQEDKKASAVRREGTGATEKVLGMPPSPGPSPKVGRKMIYNNGAELENKIIKPPEMFQDDPPKAEEVASSTSKPGVSPVKTSQGKADAGVSKQANQNSKPSIQTINSKKPEVAKKVSQLDVKQSSPASVSPASVRKIPPPTASRTGTKTSEAGGPNSKTATKSQQQPPGTGNRTEVLKTGAGLSVTEKKRELTSATQGGASGAGRGANNNNGDAKSATASKASISLVQASTGGSGASKAANTSHSVPGKLETSSRPLKNPNQSAGGSNVTSVVKKFNSSNVKPSTEKKPVLNTASDSIDDEDDDVFLDAPTGTEEALVPKNKSTTSTVAPTETKESKDKAASSIPKTKLKAPSKTPTAVKEKTVGSSDGSPRSISAGTKSPLQLRRMGPKTTEIKRAQAPGGATDASKRPTVFLDKKSVTGESTKASTAECKSPGTSSSPQPPVSPGNKPPLHPWKRPPSDSEKPASAEATPTSSIPVSQSPSASPKPSSKIPRPVGGDAPQTSQQPVSGKAGSSGGNKTPEDLTSSPPASNTGEESVMRRMRPSDRKLQTDSCAGPVTKRPRSFHELELSMAHGGSRRADRDRKCWSSIEDGAGHDVPAGAETHRFRSEPTLTGGAVVRELTITTKGGVKDEASP